MRLDHYLEFFKTLLENTRRDVTWEILGHITKGRDKNGAWAVYGGKRFRKGRKKRQGKGKEKARKTQGKGNENGIMIHFSQSYVLL
jgi:hypothetical protein